MPFRARSDPGRVLLILGLAAVCALYAPTLGRGFVNFDDHWLVRDNHILHQPLRESLPTILFDTSKETRFNLGAEYLPVRDISIALDVAVWGDWTPGYHLTNLVLYLAALIAWFAALTTFGLDRKLTGLAVLLWAVHPAHAESVAWISERKGLLGLAMCGVLAWAYARYRRGDHGRWLLLAVVAAVCAVWSKAPAASSAVVILGMEIVLPAHRRSWRRSLTGLGVVALGVALAFLPVVLTAMRMAVVDDHGRASPGFAAGVHGFYVELTAMVVRNAVSYPIATAGPTIVQQLLGALTLLVALAVAFVPARGRFRPSPVVRVGCMIWLAGWLPASHLVLPLNTVVVADRYLLFATLGFALVLASLLMSIGSSRARIAVIATIVVASCLRTLDAQSNWRDTVTLWERATVSNPDDGDAWANYVEALGEAGRSDLQFEALRTGLQRAPSSRRLLLHEALFVLEHGRREQGIQIMRRAAELGEPRAMANLGVLLLADGDKQAALEWARRSVIASPVYAKGFATLGAAASANGFVDEAVSAYSAAYRLSPDEKTRFELATALIAAMQYPEARGHLVACLADPRFTQAALRALAAISGR